MAKLPCARHGSNIYGSYKSGYWREQSPWHIQLELWSRIVRMDKNCSSGEENKNEKGILVVRVQCGKQGQWMCVQIVCRSLRAQGREAERCTGDSAAMSQRTSPGMWKEELWFHLVSDSHQLQRWLEVFLLEVFTLGAEVLYWKLKDYWIVTLFFFNTLSSELIPLSTASSPWRKVRTWIWLFRLHISKYCS